MEVILLEKVRNLGNLGDKVKVRQGYGRNYLLPQRKAVSATTSNLEKFEARRAELEQRAKEVLASAQAKAAELNAVGSVTIPAKVAEEGKLYGSVNVAEVVTALKALNVNVQKSDVKLTAGVIRHIGEYDAEVYLHSDVTASVKVVVVPEAN